MGLLLLSLPGRVVSGSIRKPYSGPLQAKNRRYYLNVDFLNIAIVSDEI